ncbi:hypothetical protein C9374_013264 [Naegleria lovaniensis]|uniref:Uncharacterized protein n=1 Tax=Naegleria lovaniensis TaxID=51637 RepID=A0AA88KQH2_NAELO|nr:uncharacterized protein C9374_013264 [Naegleria lovaniensis]KAG2391779.1 hypothetical protein C9374_013264 [Naegleria lovaniensis]
MVSNKQATPRNTMKDQSSHRILKNKSYYMKRKPIVRLSSAQVGAVPQQPQDTSHASLTPSTPASKEVQQQDTSHTSQSHESQHDVVVNSPNHSEEEDVHLDFTPKTSNPFSVNYKSTPENTPDTSTLMETTLTDAGMKDSVTHYEGNTTDEQLLLTTTCDNCCAVSMETIEQVEPQETNSFEISIQEFDATESTHMQDISDDIIDNDFYSTKSNPTQGPIIQKSLIEEMRATAQELSEYKQQKKVEKELCDQTLLKMGLDVNIPMHEHVRNGEERISKSHKFVDKDNKGLMYVLHDENETVQWEIVQPHEGTHIQRMLVRFEIIVTCGSSDHSFTNKVPSRLHSGMTYNFRYLLRVRKGLMDMAPCCVLTMQSSEIKRLPFHTILHNPTGRECIMDQNEMVFEGHQKVTIEWNEYCQNGEKCQLQLKVYHDKNALESKTERIHAMTSLSCFVQLSNDLELATPHMNYDKFLTELAKQSLFKEVSRFNIFNLQNLEIRRELVNESISLNEIEQELQQAPHSLHKYNLLASKYRYVLSPPCSFESLDCETDLEELRHCFECLGVDVYDYNSRNTCEKNMIIPLCPEEVLLMYQAVAKHRSRQTTFLYAKLLSSVKLSNLNDHQREYLALLYCMLSISTFVNPQVTTLVSPFERLPDQKQVKKTRMLVSTDEHDSTVELRHMLYQQTEDYFPQCLNLSADSNFFEQVFQSLSLESSQRIMQNLLARFNFDPVEWNSSMSMTSLIEFFPPLMTNFIRSGVFNSRPLAIRCFFGKFCTLLLCKLSGRETDDLQQRVHSFDMNNLLDTTIVVNRICDIVARTLDSLYQFMQKEKISFEDLYFLNSALTLIRQVCYFYQLLINETSVNEDEKRVTAAFEKLDKFVWSKLGGADGVSTKVFEILPLRVALGIKSVHSDISR